jgi:predicted MFS family arabinose efflux permease
MGLATAENAALALMADPTNNLLAKEPAGLFPEPEEAAEVTQFMGPTHRASSRSSWRILSQGDFRWYFFGALISNLGTWLQGTAQVLIAYHLTSSVLTVGLIASAQFAGMILVSPWAPVLADRFSARAVLVGTQFFSALIAVLMAVLYLAGMLGVSTLLVGALGLGFAFALALPVQTALVRALVNEEDVTDAVKINSVSYNAGRALAPALCVPVMIFIGPELIFTFNALSFMIFVLILRRLKRIADETSLRQTFVDLLRAGPNRTVSAARPRPRARDGLVAALQRRRLLLLMAIVAAVTLGDDPIQVLSPAVAARLHMPSTSAGYLIAALGWGSVLGSLPPTAARNHDAQRASKRAAFSLLVLGVSVVVFTVGFSSWVSLGAAVAAGAAALFTGTAAQTALLRHQNKIGADLATVASLAALWAIAWAGTKPFASLLDGWLASHTNVVATSIVLTSPAILIALCELLLPTEVKKRIDNYAGQGANRIVRRLMSSALTGAGAESQRMLDVTSLTDVPHAAEPGRSGRLSPRRENANYPKRDGGCPGLSSDWSSPSRG